MDTRDDWQYWFMNQHGISTSPSFCPSALPDPGVLCDGSSSWQGIGSRQLTVPYAWDSSGWQALPDTQYGQRSETTSETPRTKRRRRSSSFGEREHRQGCEGEAGGRDSDPPPARRQRVSTELQNNWPTLASSALPIATTIIGRASRSLSPQRCHAPQGGPTPWSGEMDHDPSAQSIWIPPGPFLCSNREDVVMRSACHSFLRQAAECESALGSRNWGANQQWEGPRCHPAQNSVVEAPLSYLEVSGGAHQEGPLLPNHGATYNIANAGNVFTGTNNGIVYMESVTVGPANEFMINLADRLKFCIRADHMYYASGDEAAFRRGQCTQGTRIDIIRGVMWWATDASPVSECVYWLSGQAGAGKTTIAYTIARQLETPFSNGNNKAVLGGSFFCSRQSLDTRSASSIVRTIVYQLAVRSQSFRAALKVFGRFETVAHGPRSQFMGLLVEPWKMSAPERLAKNEPCYVLPIDALDELEGTGGTEFLGTLFDVVNQQNLSGLKFFVTSRSEPALVEQITSFSNKQVCRLEEVPLDESSADIKVYLEETLSQCATTQQIQQLVTDATGLFIYAATVVEFVKGRSLDVQRSLLNQLLPTSPSPSCRPSRNTTATLDNLYLQILETSLVDPRDRGDPDVFQACLSVLHTFLCTIERTSAAVAVAILIDSSEESEVVLSTGAAEEILGRLHAVLYSQGGLVMSFHKSFADFLFDARRSQRFFCNREQHHHRLANGCFRIMAKQLRFNIASISSSYQVDSDNPTLAASIYANISVSLRYACRNWSAHLILAPFEALDDLRDAVHQFLQLRVLFWLESMNLLGKGWCCQGMLRDGQRWFSESEATELVSKLADAAAFARHHSTSKAALSTPHLYLSSLATFPRHSAVVQNWKQQFGGTPGFTSAHGVGGEAMVTCITLKDELIAFAISPNGASVAIGQGNNSVQVWDLSTGEEVRVLRGHTNVVNTIAYSPDGTHIVSVSSDGSIRIWDLATGEQVMALKTKPILSVAYSPDGTRVVSGSGDASVWVWDLSTGEEVMFLEGHTGGVRAVAYSPDGSHIVSGSDDRSLRIWDLSTGEVVRVLEGHAGDINAVVYSPDGTCLVSCSDDQTIRVWDMSTGDEMMVLKGHTGEVWAVAYSPEGTHVVSGSADKSVRVWDLSTGKEVSILKGHTYEVGAVAYLPDGAYVVSGSSYDSLRVWDLSAREEKKVHTGHTGGVTALAFSLDGTHLVMGSSNQSIWVWDLSTLEEVSVLTGHTSAVCAVAYSPDGTHVVSGSGDKSVRVWDLSTGREDTILHGHTGEVWAVAYSPDGMHVVSGSNDTSIRVWDLAASKQVRVLTGHTHAVDTVAYSPDGTHVVSGSQDKSVRVWDMSTGDEVRLFKGHTNEVLAVAYSPDGTHIASGSSDKSVRLWDLSTGEVRVPKGVIGWGRALSYSPDGAHLISGSEDKSLRVWDVSTLEEVRVLKLCAGGVHPSTFLPDVIQLATWSPDGKHVAFRSWENSVHVWDIFSDHTPRYIHQEGPDGKSTGWLLSPSDPSAHLMFVQPEAHVPDDFNVVTLPTSSVSYVDFSNAKFGERWAECFTPRSL